MLDATKAQVGSLAAGAREPVRDAGARARDLFEVLASAVLSAAMLVGGWLIIAASHGTVRVMFAAILVLSLLVGLQNFYRGPKCRSCGAALRRPAVGISWSHVRGAWQGTTGGDA